MYKIVSPSSSDSRTCWVDVVELTSSSLLLFSTFRENHVLPRIRETVANVLAKRLSLARPGAGVGPFGHQSRDTTRG